MGKREINGAMLVVALGCLIPALAGLALLLADGSGGDALGLALLGFFGAGAVVLGRQALTGGR